MDYTEKKGYVQSELSIERRCEALSQNPKFSQQITNWPE